MPAKAAPKADAKKAAPVKPTVAQWKKSHKHLFPAKPKQLGIGQDKQVTKDLTRYVKMPVYVRIQRQRSVLKQRVKVPAAINQFTQALKKDQATTLFGLMAKYRPETRKAKKERLTKAAAEKADNKEVKKTEKAKVLKYGLNHVTSLIEKKRAKLVVIAHDVNPIELVVFLPALCRKYEVPYVIVHNKSRLGYLVHKKQTAVVAITDINAEDQPKLQQVIDATTALQATKARAGGLKLSQKTKAKLALREKKLKNTIQAK
eukprot:UN01101